MDYILNGSDEVQRLNDQSDCAQFSLKNELSGITFSPGSHLMDAGCGSGVLCRYLEKNAPDCFVYGCDVSKISLSYASSMSLRSETKFFMHDFVERPFNEKYDFIFNRLVAHHLNEKKLIKVCKNFYNSLHDGGELCIIDPDGLFLNLGTRNIELLDSMNRISSFFHGNLKIGRIIPSILKECGFKKVSWRIEVMDFQNEARGFEIMQWRERFESGIEFYVSFFGSESEARKFMELYLKEAQRDEVPLFYNKFIIRASK